MIRLADKTDIDALLPLVESYWHFEGLSSFDATRIRGNLEWLIAKPDAGVIYCAEEDGRLVGYLILVYVFSLEHFGLTTEIDEFYIDAPHRSRGVGEQLLAAAELSARQAGCRNLSLQIGHHNAKARAFYVRNGFRARTGFELLEKDL